MRDMQVVAYVRERKKEMRHLITFPIFVVIVAVSMLFGWMCAVYGAKYLSPDVNDLIDAIGVVESNNNDNAIGDNGKSIGKYQIGKLYWQDGCRFLKVSWPYENAKNPNKARQVVREYLLHYGRGKTLEQIARCHNGGPKGYLKPQTEAYWRKVEKVIKANR